MTVRVQYKLVKDEKQGFKDLKNQFNPEFIVDEYTETVTAIAKHPGSGCLFEVAVSHCGPGEIFNKKRGKYEALKRLDYGQYALMTSEQIAALQPY
jgi:hypothetical protein